MTCESTRGQWGSICPDCGCRLPAKKGRLMSWMAQRNIDEQYQESGRAGAAASPHSLGKKKARR